MNICSNFARLFYPLLPFLPYFDYRFFLQDPSDNSVEYTDWSTSLNIRCYYYYFCFSVCYRLEVSSLAVLRSVILAECWITFWHQNFIDQEGEQMLRSNSEVHEIP